MKFFKDKYFLTFLLFVLTLLTFYFTVHSIYSAPHRTKNLFFLLIVLFIAFMGTLFSL